MKASLPDPAGAIDQGASSAVAEALRPLRRGIGSDDSQFPRRLLCNERSQFEYSAQALAA